MANSKKRLQGRRDEMIALIKAEPGITSAEIAERLGLANSSKVSTALWTWIRSNRVMVERITRNGKTMNAHYLPDQVPPDAVERINQKLVDVKDVIPAVKAAGSRNSVFDVPGTKKTGGKRSSRKRASPTGSTPVVSAGSSASSMSRGFACAVTNDGSLVLMRAGQVQFSLSDAEASTLQSYLVKRAAASLFASMA